MEDMIAVRCHSCGVGMKVKAEYAGRAKKCPKCGTIFVVPKEDGLTLAPPSASGSESAPKPESAPPSAPVSEEIRPDAGEGLHTANRPRTLDPQARYVILDSQRAVALWQSDKGWQVMDGGRLVGAKRNPDLLPKVGDFRLVELQFGEIEGEMRVSKIRIFKLANQYSVTKIAGDDFAVLGTITGTSGLMRSQKSVLLSALKSWFMRGMWADAQTIYDYLLNDDYHSAEVQ